MFKYYYSSATFYNTQQCFNEKRKTKFRWQATSFWNTYLLHGVALFRPIYTKVKAKNLLLGLLY